jgi:hypothetical protein
MADRLATDFNNNILKHSPETENGREMKAEDFSATAERMYAMRRGKYGGEVRMKGSM